MVLRVLVEVKALMVVVKALVEIKTVVVVVRALVEVKTVVVVVRALVEVKTVVVVVRALVEVKALVVVVRAIILLGMHIRYIHSNTRILKVHHHGDMEDQDLGLQQCQNIGFKEVQPHQAS